MDNPQTNGEKGNEDITEPDAPLTDAQLAERSRIRQRDLDTLRSYIHAPVRGALAAISAFKLLAEYGHAPARGRATRPESTAPLVLVILPPTNPDPRQLDPRHTDVVDVESESVGGGKLVPVRTDAPR